jgi:hypothetical protein
LANTYPLHVMFEAPYDVPEIVIASLPEAGRNIDNWKLYRSRDPAAMGDAAHSSWTQIATGTGDSTIAVT